MTLEGYPKMEENPKIFMIEKFRLQKSCWLVKVINTATGDEAFKGNSTVKTNRAQINVHTFNKLFPKNLGPNHFSKREIVRQSSQIIQISTPCCSFPCRRKSGQRPECDVIACFFIAGIKNTYRRAIQISKTTSCYKQNAALCCAIVRKWQSKNQRDGYKLS